jgi:hypothetical protein
LVPQGVLTFAQAGFKDVLLEPLVDPCMIDALRSASGSTYTPQGFVEMAWQVSKRVP